MMDSCSAAAFLSDSVSPSMPRSISVTISRMAGGRSVRRGIGSYGLRPPSFKTELLELLISLLPCGLVQPVVHEFLVGESAVVLGKAQGCGCGVTPLARGVLDAQVELPGTLRARALGDRPVA